MNLEWDANLSNQESKEIKRLLLKAKHSPPDLQDIWNLMDVVWNELNCDNVRLNWEEISAFYRHPIWILYGLFVEQDETSLRHRQLISDWINQNQITSVVDFGGGFGTLARMLAEKGKKLTIDVCEPHPSQYAILKTKSYENIKFVESLERKYDCLISTDVLEHVPDPLNSLAEMIAAVKIDGYLIVANCFRPVIKCHLPMTFHFRYTFNLFAEMMGLKMIHKLNGSHAFVYQKVSVGSFDWKKLRRLEKVSKILFPLISFGTHLLKAIGLRR
ncbi:class I SAM-dependent methyltransferase [Phormidesmis sp. 146-35]